MPLKEDYGLKHESEITISVYSNFKLINKFNIIASR